MITTEKIRLNPNLDVVRDESVETVLDTAATELGSLAIVRAGYSHTERDSIVMAQPWSGYVERADVTELIGFLSQETDRAVISTDNFGMGAKTARTDRDVAREVRSGSFDSVTTSQWEAIDTLPDGQTTLLGYSLGASIAASQLKTKPEHVDVERLVLWEGVVEATPLPLLIARFGLEAAKWKQYFPQNPDWMVERGSEPFMPKGTLPHIRSYAEYPMGLSKGHMFADLAEARERETLTPNTEVVVVSGELSRVSPPESNYQLAEKISQTLGVKSVRHLVLMGESHGLIDSAPKVSSALKKML